MKISCPLNWFPPFDGSVASTEPRAVFVALSNASPTAYSCPPLNEQVAETGMVTATFELGFCVVDVKG